MTAAVYQSSINIRLYKCSEVTRVQSRSVIDFSSSGSSGFIFRFFSALILQRSLLVIDVYIKKGVLCTKTQQC